MQATPTIGKVAGGTSRRPSRSVILPGALVVAIVSLGIWGITADRSERASVGDPVGLDGGSIEIVEAWTLGDPMAGMHASTKKFAEFGMSMSQMLPDAVAEGMKRVAVQVHLVASGNERMEFPARAFTLVAADSVYAPYRTLLGDQYLEPGEQLDGVLVFEVPAAMAQASLESELLAAPIYLDFGPGSEHGHVE